MEKVCPKIVAVLFLIFIALLFVFSPDPESPSLSKSDTLTVNDTIAPQPQDSFPPYIINIQEFNQTVEVEVMLFTRNDSCYLVALNTLYNKYNLNVTDTTKWYICELFEKRLIYFYAKRPFSD